MSSRPFFGPRRPEGDILCLFNSASWVQEDEKARSGISSTRLLGSKKTKRRDPTSRQLDFLGPRRREGEIRHLVNSISWVQEGKKERTGISSTRLLGSKKTRRQNPASRQLDFLGPRRREDGFRQLVNSTSWVQEDEKARSGISSTRLLGSKKTKRRDPTSRQLDFLGPRRREGEIRHLVNSISWAQEGKKERTGISSTRLLGSKKTRRRNPASRQLDFLGPSRREDEIRHLVNSASWVQKGEKTGSGNSSTRRLGSKKTRRRDSASRQLNFLGPRRQEDEIRHLVNSTSWVQEGEKMRSGISSTRLLASKKAKRRFLDLVKLTSWVQEGEKASFYILSWAVG